MTEVAVERHQLLVSVCVCVRDTVEVRTADAVLSAAMHHRKPRISGPKPLEQVARTVGRRIVDEEDVRIELQRA